MHYRNSFRKIWPFSLWAFYKIFNKKYVSVNNRRTVIAREFLLNRFFMLFWMLPIRFKNFDPIIKKIQKQIFQKSKIRNKTKTNRWIIKNYFLPQYRIKKTKKNHNYSVKIDRIDPEIKRYTYKHTHTHTHPYRNFSKIMWYKLLTPLIMFLDKFNETQNCYYYKASSRRKQKQYLKAPWYQFASDWYVKLHLIQAFLYRLAVQTRNIIYKSILWIVICSWSNSSFVFMAVIWFNRACPWVWSPCDIELLF